MATLRVRWNGALVTPRGLFVKQNGALVAKPMSVRWAGALRSVVVAALSITPGFSNQNVPANNQISQAFTIDGSTAGTWSVPAGFAASNQTATGITLSATQSGGSLGGTLVYTASDGRQVSANLNWSWGVIQ